MLPAPTAIRIRPATPGDAAVLAEVHIASWRAAYHGLVPGDFLAGLSHERRVVRFREQLEASPGDTFVVEQEGRPFGFVTLGGCRDEDVDPHLTGEIWGIYLAPQHRRRGAGTRLCRCAERVLESRGYRRLKLWVLAGNRAARRFYEAMGFEADGVSKVLNLGAPLEAVRYNKEVVSIEEVDVDKDGFRALLRTRKLSEEAIEASVALAERFEAFAAASGAGPSAQAAAAFSRLLMEEEQNTEANYLALARYGRFTHNDELFVAILELLDGAEAQANLYRLVGEAWGDEVRDRAFAGIGLSPLGLPSADKPRSLHPVLARLAQEVGEEACRQLLSGSLRDLPDRYFLGERRRYRRAADVDAYLRNRHRAFVRELKKCQREGRLFFAQEVTDEVVALVESDPEIESGRREGNVVYVSKIPYMAKQFLAETDPTLKRYYACHCPWAREAIKNGDVPLYADFCYCSAGFHKKPWEVIFRHPVQAEVIESVLRGDARCRFAIHLPPEARIEGVG